MRDKIAGAIILLNGCEGPPCSPESRCRACAFAYKAADATLALEVDDSNYCDMHGGCIAPENNCKGCEHERPATLAEMIEVVTK